MTPQETLFWWVLSDSDLLPRHKVIENNARKAYDRQAALRGKVEEFISWTLKLWRTYDLLTVFVVAVWLHLILKEIFICAYASMHICACMGDTILEFVWLQNCDSKRSCHPGIHNRKFVVDVTPSWLRSSCIIKAGVLFEPTHGIVCPSNSGLEKRTGSVGYCWT